MTLTREEIELRKVAVLDLMDELHEADADFSEEIEKLKSDLALCDLALVGLDMMPEATETRPCIIYGPDGEQKGTIALPTPEKQT